jgi:aminopeptidase N
MPQLRSTIVSHYAKHQGHRPNNGHGRFELPGARPHYTPDRPGQVEHIALDLVLDIAQRQCQGVCTTRLQPIRTGITTLTMDAVELTIQAVTIAGVTQRWEHDGESLHIQLQTPTQQGEAIDIAIQYQLQNSRRGMYFVGPDQHYPHKPIQVWTQGEDEDSRFWFPCFDYPGQLSTSAIRVQVPKPYMAISNGSLIDTQVAGDHKIYHWHQKQVHPTYLMTLAVGDFVELRDEWQGKPVTYYVDRGREASAQLSLGKTPRMMAFFSQTYGYDYAYDKYAQVCVDDYIFGGMENTSTTLLTDRCLLDERAAIDNLSTETLVAHELAHQWFGDLAVIKHWSHAWLKEGMASYAEVLWLGHEYSPELAAYYRLGQARQYLSEDADRYRRPLVTHVYREAIELYDSHIYEKGSCVYHMLRAELGEPLFNRAIAHFLHTHAHQTVETIDLLRAIEQSTGRNLTYLFDQYVYRGGHPDYKVSYSWESDSNLAKITITQTQATGESSSLDRTDLFDLKIPIGFGWFGERLGELPSFKPSFKTVKVRVHEKEQTLYFPLDSKPDWVRFDVDNHILKTVTLALPVIELKNQLVHDPDPIARLHAAAALATKGGLEAVNALATALKTEKFWGVRVEIAQNLAKIKLEQAFAALVVGLQDPEARVRRATIEALSTIKTAASYAAVRAIAQSGDPSYYVEAAALRALGAFATSGLADAPAETAVLQQLDQALQTKQGWNEVVRIGAIGALSQMKTSSAALALLTQYTQLGVPQPLRLAAIRACGSISTGQDKPGLATILNHLKELSGETFFLTQVAVVVALEQMETPQAIGILRSLAQQTMDGRVRRMAEEAIQTVQKNSEAAQSVKQLRDDFEQLKQENQDLRSRLELLEAKSKTGVV